MAATLIALQSRSFTPGTFDETVSDRAREWLDNLAASHEPLWLVLEQSEAAAAAHIEAWKRRSRTLATSTRAAWHLQPQNRNSVDAQCAAPSGTFRHLPASCVRPRRLRLRLPCLSCAAGPGASYDAAAAPTGPGACLYSCRRCCTHRAPCTAVFSAACMIDT